MKVKLMLVYCLISFCSCFHNPPERNKLVFKDSYKDVQDSLLRIIALLPQLPSRKDNLNRNYRIENGKLLINDTLRKDGLMKSKEFVNLATYLNKNFVSCSYSDYSSKSWVFMYRVVDDQGFNDSRNIILLDNKNLISSDDSVIDKKDKMYLVVGKGAIVR